MTFLKEIKKGQTTYIVYDDMHMHMYVCDTYASQANQWLLDLDLLGTTGWTTDLIDQLVGVWSVVQTIHLVEHEEDNITWKLTTHGEYTTTSAYNAQLLGITATNFNRLIWKAWAPHKCKTFAWLIIQNRVWTSDRLATRGWPNGYICPLCRRTQETTLHLLAECRYTRRVWATKS
uniref:Cyst nematode resistance protein-like n=1 Tax=Oryza sativa subsp. japonica TaxID=39947 RepID=Q6Z698_ORYSJ|nr:cyst nematode resistance protein-like [Oryza sativa Japonica Group]